MARHPQTPASYASPSERGLPFSVWSVPKLAEYCPPTVSRHRPGSAGIQPARSCRTRGLPLHRCVAQGFDSFRSGRRRKLLPPVTDEWVRRLLRREGLTAQRVRTWKTSNDPAFDRKKNAFGRSIEDVRRIAQ